MTKHPPLTSKRALPSLYLFKTLPHAQKKKSVLPQRSPPNEQNLYLFKTPPSYVKKNGAFILNAPSTSNKAVITTRSPKMTKFLCLFKTPPPPR